MDTASLTWKSVTGRSAEMRQRFHSALHGAGSNLRRALLLQTASISYRGRLHVCWITRAESFASAWNAGSERSCCLLSNQNRLYGLCDTHLRQPENAACYHLYALGFFSSGVENKELCRQAETEKMCCDPTGFRDLRKQRGKTLWARRFDVMWTTFLTLCLLLCSSTLLWKQHIILWLQRTPVSLGQIFLSFWETEPNFLYSWYFFPSLFWLLRRNPFHSLGTCHPKTCVEGRWTQCVCGGLRSEVTVLSLCYLCDNEKILKCWVLQVTDRQTVTPE